MWSCTSLPLVGHDPEEEDDGMFTVHCPHHGSDVLLPESNIESMRNGATGIEVRWVCTCGHRGSFVTGRRAGSSLAIL
jgi:hypothetical protein